MSRTLWNGRAYDPDQPPPPPKLRKRKNAKKSGLETGELAVSKKSGGPTFGSLPPSEKFPDVSSVIAGTGRLRGFLLVEGSDVRMKMAPSMFRAMYKRAPPIKKQDKAPTASTMSSDARQQTDASADQERDATSQGSEAAQRALVLRGDSNALAAVRAPAAYTSAPISPVGDVDDGRNHSPDDSNVYHTARTSRVREDTMTGDRNIMSFAQYMIEEAVNESPTHTRRSKRRKTRSRSPALSEPSRSPAKSTENVNSWEEEVLRAEHSPERAEVNR